jgi:hypothetical protein
VSVQTGWVWAGHESAPAPRSELATIRRTQRDRTLGMVRRTPGLTASELARVHGVADVYEIRRRLTELFQGGEVRRVKRRCGVDRRDAYAYRPTA